MTQLYSYQERLCYPEMLGPKTDVKSYEFFVYCYIILLVILELNFSYFAHFDIMKEAHPFYRPCGP